MLDVSRHQYANAHHAHHIASSIKLKAQTVQFDQLLFFSDSNGTYQILIRRAVDPAKDRNGAVALGSLKRGSTSATRYTATNPSRLAKAVVTRFSIVFGDTVTLLMLLG